MKGDLHGSLVTVSTRVMGDQFAVAASIGATTLSLNDVSDFDEDGGFVSIAGTVYAYDSADMDLDTIHLTSTLAAATLVGDRVDIWDADSGVTVSENVALVSVEDQDGDPIGAVVDHALTTLLADGTLTTGQSVSMVRDGVGYRLNAVHGKNNQALARSDSTGLQFGIDQNDTFVMGIVCAAAGTPLLLTTTGDARVKTPSGSGFMPILASAFTVSSDSSTKTTPQPAPDALAIIAAAPASTWRYLTDDATVERIGPMADDLPRWLAQVDPEDGTLGIDLARMSGLHHRAIEQLLARVEALEGALADPKNKKGR